MDKIQLFLPNKRKGIIICRRKYLHLVQIILETLKESSDNCVTLTDLIEKVNRKYISENDISWYLLQVKLDLQEKKIITSSINRNRVQEIKLNLAKYKRHVSSFSI